MCQTCARSNGYNKQIKYYPSSWTLIAFIFNCKLSIHLIIFFLIYLTTFKINIIEHIYYFNYYAREIKYKAQSNSLKNLKSDDVDKQTGNSKKKKNTMCAMIGECVDGGSPYRDQRKLPKRKGKKR